jgi:hypothetical protein
MKIFKDEVIAYVRAADGTMWAFPTPTNLSWDSAAWRLRHTEWEPAESERLCIADLLDSYRMLVYAPQKKRNLIIKAIREAMKEESKE